MVDHMKLFHPLPAADGGAGAFCCGAGVQRQPLPARDGVRPGPGRPLLPQVVAACIRALWQTRETAGCSSVSPQSMQPKYVLICACYLRPPCAAILPSCVCHRGWGWRPTLTLLTLGGFCCMVLVSLIGQCVCVRRVSGNTVNDYVMGSIVHAVQQLGVRCVVILGHTRCAGNTQSHTDHTHISVHWRTDDNK